MTKEADTGTMQLRARERPGPPANREARRGEEGCSSTCFRGGTALLLPWSWTSTRPPDPRTERQQICVVLSSRSVVTCYSGRRKLIQWERRSPQPLPCRRGDWGGGHGDTGLTAEARTAVGGLSARFNFIIA